MKPTLSQFILTLVLIGAWMPSVLVGQTTHSYYFQGNFSEGGGIGPALSEVLSCSAGNGSYANQTIVTSAGNCGTGTQQVFSFNTGGGLSYTNNNFIGGTYTINMFFKFNEMTGYQRIIDFKNGTTDNGLYTLSQCLNFFPTGNQGTCPFFEANIYYLITLVRDGTTNLIKVYVNGSVFVNNYNDSSGDYVPTTGTTPIILFRDNIPPSSANCEDSPGAIRFFSVKNTTSTDGQVLSTWNNICNIAGCIPPEITCPENVTASADAGQCNAVVTYPPATATGATEPITYTQNSGTYFPIGVTTVTATATNGTCSSSCTFTVTVTGAGGGSGAEINLQGNSTNIADGDVTPSSSDHTDFGSVNVGSSFPRTYTIQNTGSGPLTINDVTITGTNPGDFAVSGISLPSTIVSSSSATFVVTFSPAAVDQRSAVVHVSNDDCNEPDYNFMIQGFGLQPTTPDPTSVTATQNPVCNGFATQLTANGAAGTVYWYTGSCGGTQVGTGNPFTVSPTSTTTYYARNYDNGQYSGGCASLSVTVNQPSYVPPARTVADLQATGTGIQWYAAASGGSPLATSTPLVNGTHYYASQMVNGIESTSRLDVTATLDNTPCKPTGSSGQTFSAGATVADLSATGSNIRWYSVASGGTALSPTTPLVNGNHYYGTQTIDCTESATRLDVTVTLN